jgi:molybdenum cofactor guanylyltransferase
VYHQAVDALTGFVLAGGKSSRMGQDKAFLKLGGITLLERALRLAKAATGNATIVGNASKFAGFGVVIEDQYPECGPLGGIHAALAQTSTDLNLIVAVDLPFLRPEFLRYLIAQAGASDAMALVPRSGEKLQPLCAMYRRAFAEYAERSLRAGRNRINRLFSEVPTRVIEPEELKQNGFGEEMFRNLNTPEDWEKANAFFSVSESD